MRPSVSYVSLSQQPRYIMANYAVLEASLTFANVCYELTQYYQLDCGEVVDRLIRLGTRFFVPMSLLRCQKTLDAGT